MSHEKNIILHILRSVSNRLAKKNDEQYWAERGFFTIDPQTEASILESARIQYKSGLRDGTIFANGEAAKMSGDDTQRAQTFLASLRIFGALHYEQTAEALLEARDTVPEAVYNTVKGSRSLTRNGRAWKQNARVGYRTNIKLDM